MPYQFSIVIHIYKVLQIKISFGCYGLFYSIFYVDWKKVKFVPNATKNIPFLLSLDLEPSWIT